MSLTIEQVQTGAAPQRSLEQRMEALARANEIRSRRAVLKQDLKFRRVDPLQVLAEVPPELETMKLYNLLVALPKVGRVKANKILRATKTSPAKTLGGLSSRQRAEIAVLLRR